MFSLLVLWYPHFICIHAYVKTNFFADMQKISYFSWQLYQKYYLPLPGYASTSLTSPNSIPVSPVFNTDTELKRNISIRDASKQSADYIFN
jgi:hypothetical protein